VKRLTALIIVAAIIGMPVPCHALSKSVQVNVSCTIAPMFELDVSGPTGGNIEFGTLHKDPNGTLTFDSNEVTIRAKTNMGQPYHVTQMLVTPIRNANGDEFEAGDFTSRATAEGPGSPVVRDGFVTTQPMTLLSSNDGKSSAVTASYKLKVKPGQASGFYASKLIYTIATI